jgi:hypothetical protein
MSGMYSPPGWVNPTTPGSATTSCGAIKQTKFFTAVDDNAVQIGFDYPLSWTGPGWTTTDPSGILWTCQVPGVYNIYIAQTLEVQNVADIDNPTVTLNLSIVDANNAELNQTYTNTIFVPVTTGTVPLVGCSLTAIVNANVGTELIFALASPSGGVSIVSGNGAEDSGTYQAFTYNLISQGVYGTVIPPP